MPIIEMFDLVKLDIEDRRAKGWREHGRPMIADGSRDSLKEAYEECLDLAIYLREEIEKRAAT